MAKRTSRTTKPPAEPTAVLPPVQTPKARDRSDPLWIRDEGVGAPNIFVSPTAHPAPKASHMSDNTHEGFDLDESAFDEFTPDTARVYAAVLEEVKSFTGGFRPSILVKVRLSHEQPNDPDGTVGVSVGGRQVSEFIDTEVFGRRFALPLGVPKPWSTYDWNGLAANTPALMVRLGMGTRKVKDAVDADGNPVDERMPIVKIVQFFAVS